MAVQPTLAVSNGRHAEYGEAPRLRLKREAPISGYVDGAWWPHSNDLATELTDLVSALAVRLGGISRVMYNFGEWAAAPRRDILGGNVIRLDGYHRQPPGTIEVLNILGSRIVLLVVPPQTDPDDAHAILTAASANDDATSVDKLLASATPHAERN